MTGPASTLYSLWLALLMLLTLGIVTLAQSVPPPGANDSAAISNLKSAEPIVSRRDLEMLGGAVFATAAVAPFDHCIQHNIRTEDLRTSASLVHVANALAFTGGPGPFVLGGALYLAGEGTGSRSVASLGLTTTEATVVAAALNGLIKGFAGRALPNAKSAEPGEFSFGRGFHDGNGAFVSFPSGHTAASFATATVMVEEAAIWNPQSRHIVAPIAYATATLVAVSRLYQNVHWASDLPIGAAIGIWSGRTVVRWQHRHPNNWLARELLGANVLPNSHDIRITASFGLGDH